jgi:membrane dipeptidase
MPERVTYAAGAAGMPQVRHGPARVLARAARVVAPLLLAGCTAAPPAEAPAASPQSLHQRLLTIDTHLDTPIHFDRPGWRFDQRHDFASDLSHVDLPRMAEGGLDGGFFVIYTQQGPLTEAGYAAARRHALTRLEGINRVISSASGGELQLARRADDAARIDAAGQRFAYISIENSYPLGESAAGLAEWWQAGVRMAGPVHSRTNQFADSATGEARWGGLSPLGRQWVAEMNRLGMMIDASHASDAALDEMMALSSTPVILSHSGLKAIYDHPRNISDARLRALAAQGGVLHLNSVFLTRFNNSPARQPLYDRFDRIETLSADEQRALAAEWAELDRSERVNDTDFDRFMAALLHCLRIAGVRHCGIGADWDGGGGVRGLEDVAALPRISAALTAAGYDEADMALIWSGNLLRVMRAVERQAQRGHR